MSRAGAAGRAGKAGRETLDVLLPAYPARPAPPAVNLQPLTLQFRESAAAVALNVLLDAEQVQHAQQQVARGHRLALVREMTVAFELPVRAADEHVRHVIVLVLIRVAHV